MSVPWYIQNMEELVQRPVHTRFCKTSQYANHNAEFHVPGSFPVLEGVKIRLKYLTIMGTRHCQVNRGIISKESNL